MTDNQPFKPISAFQRQFLQALNAKNVEYVVTGSYAGRWYGLRRLPNDLDIVADPEARNVDRLVQSLYDLPCINPQSLLTQFLQPGKEFHWKDVEVSNGVPSLLMSELLLERTLVTVEGLLVPIISLHLFRRSKESALADLNRPEAKRLLDREDLDALFGDPLKVGE